MSTFIDEDESELTQEPATTAVATLAPEIVSVFYSRLHNLGNYENEKVGATAKVEAGQDPVQVLAGLKAWCDEKIGIADEVDDLREKKRTLTHDIERLELNLRDAKERWDKAKAFLNTQGVDPKDRAPWE